MKNSLVKVLFYQQMSRQIFSVYFLLLLIVCCELYGQGCVAQGAPLQDNTDENTFSEFLKPDEQLKIAFTHDGNPESTDKAFPLKSIGSTFLIGVENVMVAVAEVNDENKQDEQINFLAKLFKNTEGENWGKEAVKKANGNEWKTQLTTESAAILKSKLGVKGSAVVVKDKKIYYLYVTKCTGTVCVSSGGTSDPEWHAVLVVGDINGSDLKSKAIKWELVKQENLFKTKNLKDVLNPKATYIPPTVGFGFVVEDKIVFAVQGEGEKGNKGKNVTAFFELDEPKNELKPLNEESTEKCYCSLFLWKKQIVMAPSVCTTDSNREIKVFEYKDNQFKANNTPSTFLPEFLKDKKNFLTTKIVTTKIDTETDLLLFTQECEITNSAENVCLWMTDGSRTAKVDTIITRSKDSSDLSMLHINNELFVLHEQKPETRGTGKKPSHNLKRLPDQLEKIKSVLEAWKDTNNNKIKNLFDETATTGTSSFTNGLVGFLAGDSQNDDYWKDEFFYENATVTPTEGEGKPTKVPGGFKFNGAGAGAKWPVGKSKERQPYNFANPGFTLVATVTVDKGANKEKKNSILGIGLEGDNTQKKGIELWCDNGKWSVENKKSTEEAKSITKQCVPGGIYHVALLLKDKNFSLYIGKNKIEDFLITTIGAKEPLNITHFYFGVDSDAEVSSDTAAESHVTVTNVLLYNRQFNPDEIGKLKEDVEPVEVPKSLDDNTNTTPQGNNDEPTTLPQGSTGEEKKDEKEGPSPSRTEDGGVGGGVRVFSLLLAVLCVSAPLLHL